MADARPLRDSLGLADVVPQDPGLNRRPWAELEEAARGLARERGEPHVVTGPVSRGARGRAPRGRVPVPTDLSEAVHDPRGGRAAAHLAANAPGAGPRVVPVAEPARLAGVDPFPAPPAAAPDPLGLAARGREGRPGPAASPRAGARSGGEGGEAGPGRPARLPRSLPPGGG